MRLSSLGLLAAAIGAATAVALDQPRSGGSAGARSTLAGHAFVTTYPASWTRSVSHPVAGATEFQLSSGSSGLDAAGIPVPGGVGITVEELPIAVVAAGDPGAGEQNPLELLPHVIETPPSATGVLTAVALHRTRLGGRAAAAIAFSYSYEGVANVQADIVARAGAQLVSIELDSEPAVTAAGGGALDALGADWRWR